MVIGITGGVGSGKSTVLDYLKTAYQAQIIQEDLVARELMEPGQCGFRAVVSAFGRDILLPSGGIDRPKLSAVVFSDGKKLQLLNSLTHPLVEQEVRRRIADFSGLSVVETALPEEAGLSGFCDAVWYVHVPVKTRILRLMESRGYSREKCRRVMESQLSDDEFRTLADSVIENGGTPEETWAQVDVLMHALQAGSKE